MPNRVGSCTRGHKRPGRNVAVRMSCARSFSGAGNLLRRDHHVYHAMPAPHAAPEHHGTRNNSATQPAARANTATIPIRTPAMAQPVIPFRLHRRAAEAQSALASWFGRPADDVFPSTCGRQNAPSVSFVRAPPKPAQSMRGRVAVRMYTGPAGGL